MRVLDEDRLLVLERVSRTTKLYAVSLESTDPIPDQYRGLESGQPLEALSGDSLSAVDRFEKSLVFSTDDHEGFPSKIEGIAMPNPTTMILINDNDFGYTDAETSIARISYDQPITGGN